MGPAPVDAALASIGRRRRVRVRVPSFLAAVEIAARSDLDHHPPVEPGADSGRHEALRCAAPTYRSRPLHDEPALARAPPGRAPAFLVTTHRCRRGDGCRGHPARRINCGCRGWPSRPMNAHCAQPNYANEARQIRNSTRDVSAYPAERCPRRAVQVGQSALPVAFEGRPEPALNAPGVESSFERPPSHGACKSDTQRPIEAAGSPGGLSRLARASPAWPTGCA